MSTVLLPLSSDARIKLVQIAQAFDKINELCLDQADRESKLYYDYHLLSECLLTKYDFTYLRTRLPNPHPPHDDLSFWITILADASHIPVWRIITKSMIMCFNPSSKDVELRQEGSQIRQLGFEVLDQRSLAADLYWAVEDELEDEAFDSVHEVIRAKLNQLKFFAEIGDSRLEKRADEVLRFQSYLVKKHQRQKSRVATAHKDRGKSGVDSTLTVLSLLWVLAALGPLILASQASGDKPGSVKDADFWLTLQSAMMTCLGIAIGIHPGFSALDREAKIRDRILAAVGFSCAVASNFLYVYTTPIWSALAAYGAQAVQVYMVLQLTSQIASGSAAVKRD